MAEKILIPTRLFFLQTSRFTSKTMLWWMCPIRVLRKGLYPLLINLSVIPAVMLPPTPAEKRKVCIQLVETYM